MGLVLSYMDPRTRREAELHAGPRNWRYAHYGHVYYNRRPCTTQSTTGPLYRIRIEGRLVAQNGILHGIHEPKIKRRGEAGGWHRLSRGVPSSGNKEFGSMQLTGFIAIRPPTADLLKAG